MRLATLLAAAALTLPGVAATSAWAGDTPAPANATAGFANLKDGDTVTSPFLVKFTETGLKILPAGADVPNTGHYHLLIDTTLTPEQTHYAIPKDATHLHFGKGQTETEVKLPPGHYALTMQFANGAHISYGPEMSKTIQVDVK